MVYTGILELTCEFFNLEEKLICKLTWLNMRNSLYGLAHHLIWSKPFIIFRENFIICAHLNRKQCR
jgi:hypothetical protein